MAGEFDSEGFEMAVREMIVVAIGDRLSTIRQKVDGVIQDVPSVIVAKVLSPSDGKVPIPPPYPFAMIETTGQTKSHDLIDQYLTEEDGVYDLVYETTITARCNVKIFGVDGVHYTDTIGSALEQAFNVEDYRDMIDTQYGGCRFVTTSVPITSSNSINNTYQEVTMFDAYFSIVRQYKQENVPVIEEIEVSPQDLLHIDNTPIQ